MRCKRKPFVIPSKPGMSETETYKTIGDSCSVLIPSKPGMSETFVDSLRSGAVY
ncbi:hypothetical protein [Vibrio vulnificus YJ016]|uniref:Uncharacterized protein n=1 Tax=Vibrio vulnificus (strain YJ016) TaxID=196600 RepID=Q7MC44_VIBVY|nr:hypothetical protein [Vibrio vulnificus YJ016]